MLRRGNRRRTRREPSLHRALIPLGRNVTGIRSRRTTGALEAGGQPLAKFFPSWNIVLQNGT